MKPTSKKSSQQKPQRITLVRGQCDEKVFCEVVANAACANRSLPKEIENRCQIAELVIQAFGIDRVEIIASKLK